MAKPSAMHKHQRLPRSFLIVVVLSALLGCPGRGGGSDAFTLVAPTPTPTTGTTRRIRRSTTGTIVVKSSTSTSFNRPAASFAANQTTVANTVNAGYRLDDLYEQQRWYEDYHDHLTTSIGSSATFVPTDASNPLVSTMTTTIAAQAAEPHKHEIINARLLLVGASALYGTNFACVKLLGSEQMLPVGMTSTLRFGLAALSLAPWLISNNKEETMAIAAGLEIGVWVSIGYILQAVGLQTTAASTSAFLCSMAVVVVPVLDVLTGKSLSCRQIVGTLLAIAGVGLLELDSFSFSSGDWASLVQPLAFGVGFWRTEQVMRQYPHQAKECAAAQLLAIFLACAAYTLMTESDQLLLNADLHSVLMSPGIWAALVWTGVVTTGLTIYMETVALKTLSAAETTVIFSIEPLWGALTASLLLGETFGHVAIMGGFLVLSGCLLSSLQGQTQN